MKNLILSLLAAISIVPGTQAKSLVAYFSATGNTKAVAEEIARITDADLLRIEAAEPYATNPYNDSQRVQNEAYNDLRPAVANLPSAETVAQYDTLFVGSPIWWHQPAMVVCTFLESFNLTGKVIVPFFTYGATTYLNESMHKIYKVTPNSKHVPATLPTDLNPDDITTPGPDDDSGIDMPGNARGVEAWLKKLGLLGGETAIDDVPADGTSPVAVRRSGDSVVISLPEGMAHNTTSVYLPGGELVSRMANSRSYTLQLPQRSIYLISVLDRTTGTRHSIKINL